VGEKKNKGVSGFAVREKKKSGSAKIGVQSGRDRRSAGGGDEGKR